MRRSHRKEDHPLGIIKFKIEEYFNSLEGQNFEVVDNLEPFVNGKARVLPLHLTRRGTRRDATPRHATPRLRARTQGHARPRHARPRPATPHHTTPPRHATPCLRVQECFDDLLIPTDHPGRLPSDTYYISRPGGKEVPSLGLGLELGLGRFGLGLRLRLGLGLGGVELGG